MADLKRGFLRLLETPVLRARSRRKVELPRPARPPDYSDLQVEVPLAEPVSAADLVRRFLELRRQRAVRRPRAPGEQVALGDELQVDILGYAHRALIPFSARFNHSLELAPDPLLPGFAEGLVGIPVGGSAEVKVTLPADYPVERLRGAAATFLVDVRRADEVRLPAEDAPELLEALGLGKTVDEVMDRLADQVSEEREDAREIEAQELVLDEIAARTGVELPPELIDEEIRRQWGEREGPWLAQKDFSAEEQEEALRGWLEDENLRVRTERSLKAFIGLQAVFEAEQLAVTEESFNAVLAELSQATGSSVEQLKAGLRDDQEALVHVDLLMRQLTALAHVMQRARITYLEPGSA